VLSQQFAQAKEGNGEINKKYVHQLDFFAYDKEELKK
jgi:hypothetical protein